MVSIVGVAVLTTALVFVYFQAQKLKQNVAAARSSGFRYVILPIHMMSIPWALTKRLFLPVLDNLPKGWTEQWIP